MTNTPGFEIRAFDEGSNDLKHNTTGRSIEETLLWVRSLLETGATKITVTQEDRAIRDGRREHGLDPNVEIEGPTGWRRVKASPQLDPPTKG